MLVLLLKNILFHWMLFSAKRGEGRTGERRKGKEKDCAKNQLKNLKIEGSQPIFYFLFSIFHFYPESGNYFPLTIFY
jgi:hypothetical protein